MSTETNEAYIPSMGAEGGYSLGEEEVAPLRISGFLCLILGLLSPVAYLAFPMVMIPGVAILVGLFALRRHGEAVPVGKTAAKVGIVLAFGFGALGITVPTLKQQTLGSQAEKFARDYIELIALGEYELAMEMRKNHVNRFAPTMPLKAHYQMNPSAEDSLVEFVTSSVNNSIRDRGPGAEWKLQRRPRVYTHYTFQMVDLVFEDPTGESNAKVQVIMEYQIERSSGDGQWHVTDAMPPSELIYAPAVL